MWLVAGGAQPSVSLTDYELQNQYKPLTLLMGDRGHMFCKLPCEHRTKCETLRQPKRGRL
jgi:hypothetical protein